MGLNYLIFYAFLRHLFLSVENNSCLQSPVHAVCRIVRANVRGLSWNLSDLTVASSQYDILLSSEILVSDICHVTQLLVPGFGSPPVLCLSKIYRARGMSTYNLQDGYGAFRQPKFECGRCEILVLWFVVMFSTTYSVMSYADAMMVMFSTTYSMMSYADAMMVMLSTTYSMMSYADAMMVMFSTTFSDVVC